MCMRTKRKRTEILPRGKTPVTWQWIGCGGGEGAEGWISVAALSAQSKDQ